jgi:hypothetical protein
MVGCRRWVRRGLHPYAYSCGARRLQGRSFKANAPYELPIPDSDNVSRSECVNLWLDPKAPHLQREAALRYLRDLGVPADLAKVKEEINRADYQTAKAAMDTYVAIEFRESADRALNALVELQPEVVDAVLLDKVFNKPHVLSTSLLESCLTHKAPQVRARAATSLLLRKALPKEAGEGLSTDIDPDVRLAGLLGRMADGESVSEETARAVLVKK